MTKFIQILRGWTWSRDNILGCYVEIIWLSCVKFEASTHTGLGSGSFFTYSKSNVLHSVLLQQSVLSKPVINANCSLWLKTKSLNRRRKWGVMQHHILHFRYLYKMRKFHYLLAHHRSEWVRILLLDARQLHQFPLVVTSELMAGTQKKTRRKDPSKPLATMLLKCILICPKVSQYY